MEREYRIHASKINLGEMVFVPASEVDRANPHRGDSKLCPYTHDPDLIMLDPVTFEELDANPMIRLCWRECNITDCPTYKRNLSKDI